jgi:hypothetical protein
LLCATIVALVFLVAYSISTQLVFPFGPKSAYYQVPNASQNLPDKRFSVPIEIFILESQNNRVRYADSDLNGILDGINEIWGRNANITFDLVAINRIVVPDERAEPAGV